MWIAFHVQNVLTQFGLRATRAVYLSQEFNQDTILTVANLRSTLRESHYMWLHLLHEGGTCNLLLSRIRLQSSFSHLGTDEQAELMSDIFLSAVQAQKDVTGSTKQMKVSLEISCHLYDTPALLHTLLHACSFKMRLNPFLGDHLCFWQCFFMFSSVNLSSSRPQLVDSRSHSGRVLTGHTVHTIQLP